MVADALRITGEPFFKSMKSYETASEKGETILGPSSLREMTLRRNKLQKDYLDRWQATATQGREPMDGLIMPVTPWAAARLGVTEKFSYVGYTGVFNVLGESKFERLMVVSCKGRRASRWRLSLGLR